ncbi:MAG: hypothetical protein MUO40_03540 [Anaerolineaceae bacterium]|nr:hypothetical protein [Anaerolineaceae bacterium]
MSQLYKRLTDEQVCAFYQSYCQGTCSATINNEKKTVDHVKKEMSIFAPKGSGNQTMVIFVVVSIQVKQG